jgi:hypothetical protein
MAIPPVPWLREKFWRSYNGLIPVFGVPEFAPGILADNPRNRPDRGADASDSRAKKCSGFALFVDLREKFSGEKLSRNCNQAGRSGIKYRYATAALDVARIFASISNRL